MASMFRTSFSFKLLVSNIYLWARARMIRQVLQIQF